MAVSFTYGDTLADARSYLRFRIGDTVEAYRKFYDEELDAILVKADNDVEESRGICLGILAQDPDRLVRTNDATAGAFTFLAFMQLCARRSAEWHAS